MRRKSILMSLALAIIIVLTATSVSAYSINMGDSNSDYTQDNFITRIDVSDAARSFDFDFDGFNRRFRESNGYWYLTLLASDGSYIFLDETPQPLAFQNITNADHTPVQELRFLDNGRTVTWKKTSGNGIYYYGFMKNYVAPTPSVHLDGFNNLKPRNAQLCSLGNDDYRISATLPRNLYINDTQFGQGTQTSNFNRQSFPTGYANVSRDPQRVYGYNFSGAAYNSTERIIWFDYTDNTVDYNLVDEYVRWWNGTEVSNYTQILVRDTPSECTNIEGPYLPPVLAPGQSPSHNIAPSLNHTRPQGINACEIIGTGGAFKVSWNPPLKNVSDVRYSFWPTNRLSTWTDRRLRNASSSGSISHLNLSGRSFEAQRSGLVGQTVFLQFIFNDTTWSEVANKSISTVNFCSHSVPDVVIRPSTNVTNQTHVINHITVETKDVADAITRSAYIFLMFGIWSYLLFAFIKINFTDKNYLSGLPGEQKYIFAKQKYVKLIALMALYLVTWILSNTLSAIVGGFATLEAVGNLFTIFSNILTGLLYPFLVIVSLLILIMFIIDIKKKLTFRTFGDFIG